MFQIAFCIFNIIYKIYLPIKDRYLVHLSQGLSFSAYGTALLDLAEVFNTSVELISYTMTTRAVGSIVAGIIGGLCRRFEKTCEKNNCYSKEARNEPLSNKIAGEYTTVKTVLPPLKYKLRKLNNDFYLQAELRFASLMGNWRLRHVFCYLESHWSWCLWGQIYCFFMCCPS